MAIESTAINDLISGLQSKPLQRDSDDWLFGERDDATEIDTSREDKMFSPLDRNTPQVVSLGQPFQRPLALDYPLHRPSSPTTHVRMTDWPAIAKKLALPIGLFSIFIVLLGVYFAKSESNAEAKADESRPVEVVAAAAPAPAAVVAIEQPAGEEPNAQPSVEPPAAEQAAVAEPTVDVKAVEVSVEATAVEAPTVAAPIAAPTPAAPKLETPKADVPVAAPNADVPPVAPKAEAPAAAPPTPAEPPVTVEPGSPASRFLGTSAEPTIPTVAPKAAPAPQTVPNLPPPAAKPTPAVAKPAPAAKPIARPAKKSVAQLRAEKRAAAKRAAKASVAATKSRAKKQVAAADPDEEEGPAKITGKGVLSIASTPAMEVWVDGRNSKAETPVRIILLAGKHKVTLLDKQHGKAKSFDIVIKPDETTKVVKNYQ